MVFNRWFWGLLLIAIGGFILLNNVDLFDYSLGQLISDFWPIILIILGLSMIIGHRRKPKDQIHIDVEGWTRAAEYQKSDFSEVFGDLNINAENMEIGNLKLSTVFGDQSLNLSGARLKPGINEINISGVFGDILIIIPKQMEILVDSSNVIGTVIIFDRKEDGIFRKARVKSDNYDTAADKLAISINIVFGDIKVLRA